MKFDKLHIILLLVFCVTGTLYISSIFRKSPPVATTPPEVIKAFDQEREAWKRLADEKDKTVSFILKQDSLKEVFFNQHQKIYTQLNDQLKNIPARIARIANNDDSIRAAFSN